MKWESEGGEEEEGGGEEEEEEEEEVWEVSSSDDMLITSYSRFPGLSKNIVLKQFEKWCHFEDMINGKLDLFRVFMQTYST